MEIRTKVYRTLKRRKIQSIFTENLHLIVLLLLLFIFSLSIPGISFFAILILFFALSIPLLLKTFAPRNRSRRSLFAKKFILALIPLVLFSITYFVTASSYGFLDETSAIRGCVLVNISYIIGYSINFEKLPDRPFNYIYVYLALIAGGVIFVFLGISNSSTLDIIGRTAPNFWKPGEDPINGTVFDLYAMLGMGIIPIIFYGKSQRFNSKYYKSIAILSCLIGVMALYTCILLQGRKGILSLFIVLIMTTLFKLRNIEQRSTRNFYTLLLLFVSLLLAVASDGILELLIKNFEVFSRFKNEGLESGRYQAWAEIFESMPNNLIGGRAFPITESYAHNIWLDVFYDCGILPMISLLIFHILHIQPFLKIVWSNLPETIIIFIICVMVPVFIGFQGEPVLQASIFYFATSCCFFGLIMRLSNIADLYKTSTRKRQSL